MFVRAAYCEWVSDLEEASGIENLEPTHSGNSQLHPAYRSVCVAFLKSATSADRSPGTLG